MNNIAFFLARRYLFQTAYEKNIATMIYICCIAIFISTFALTLVSAVMRGFEIATHRSLQGIHAQVIIRSFGNDLQFEEIQKVLQKEFPLVIGIAPRSSQHAMIQDAHQNPHVVLLIGIDPKREAQVSNLQTMIQWPQRAQLAAIMQQENIIVGSGLAHHLKIESSKKKPIELLYASQEKIKKRKLNFDTHTLNVGSIFKSGIEEFDNNVIFCSLTLLQDLFPEAGIDQINIKLAPGSDENHIIQQLKERFELEVYSWQHLYPALVAALKLEKYVAFIVISLIMLVASMNIISLLFMYITHKRPDIAILKAMGAAQRTIRAIFVIMGMFITLLSSTLGLFVGALVSFCLERYQLIKLPDIYYVPYLPAHLELFTLLLIIATILTISLVATLLAVRKIDSINISNVLRFEA